MEQRGIFLMIKGTIDKEDNHKPLDTQQQRNDDT